MAPAQQRTPDMPSRAIDASDTPWMMTQDAATGGLVYARAFDLSQPTISWEELQARGPLRHVEPPPDGDTERLEEALVSAGSKAIGTYAAALHAVAMAQPRRHLLTAGRPGSWETQTMQHLTWEIGGYIKASRVDQEALAVLTEVIGRWVYGPGPFTEVAETMAGVLGRVVDRSGGWPQVADQWLRVSADAEAIRSYVMYMSAAGVD